MTEYFRSVMFVVISLFFVISCDAREQVPADGAQWRGIWVGGTDLLGIQPLLIEAHINDTGTMNFPHAQIFGVYGREIANFKVDGTKTHFEVWSPQGPFVFHGELMDGIISGQIRRGEKEGRFHLRRLLPAVSAKYADLVGTYEVEPGHFIIITWGGRGFLHWCDSRATDHGFLYPHLEDSLLNSDLLAASPVVENAVKVTRDAAGNVAGIVWPTLGGPVLIGKRTAHRQERVTFSNGAVKIVGTLYLPPGPGPHPAVVITHGSGAAVRDQFTYIGDSYLFNAGGLAYLTYDKRGEGESSGDWTESMFEDLADDAVAGIRYLQMRKDIKRTQVGLWGLSQGAWLGPLAAVRSGDAAFVIAVAGGGVSPGEQEIFRVGATLRGRDVPSDEVDQAVEFMRLKFNYAQTGKGWDEYQVAFRRLRDKPWFELANPVESRKDTAWAFWRRINSYDPAPTLSKLRCPVLAFFGGRDTLTPTKRSVEVMEDVRQKSGHQDFTIQVFPEADHAMLLPGFRRNDEYYSFMISWVRTHVGLDK